MSSKLDFSAGRTVLFVSLWAVRTFPSSLMNDSGSDVVCILHSDLAENNYEPEPA